MEASSPPPATNPPSKKKEPKWPKVIGIIAIIFGSLALLQTAVAPLMIPFSIKSTENAIAGDVDQKKLDTYFADLTSLSTLSAVSLGIVAIFLLVGGTLLLKKKKAAVPLLLIWAVLKMGFGCFFNYRNYLLMQTQFELMIPATGGGQEAEIVNSITTISSMVGMIFGSLWILAFPVFLLIWFSRSKVREFVRSW